MGALTAGWDKGDTMTVSALYDRQAALLERLARPLLHTAGQGRLRIDMPAESRGREERAAYAYLKAVGRLLCGMAPFLERERTSGEPRRQQLVEDSRHLMMAVTDPQSPDFFAFTDEPQQLVDAAYLAQAMIRAPNALWADLPAAAKGHVVAALERTRATEPYANNWLLFSAMVEAGLALAGQPWDAPRIDHALRQFDGWYAGDGHYGDGQKFRADYYNSYVIHPMLVDIVDQVSSDGDRLARAIRKRAMRYAGLQERMIGPDGSFPPLGRSLTCRCGAFQALAQAALKDNLPGHLPPSQVRGALHAVIERTLGHPDTFDAEGWLRIGLNGAQPGLGEIYVTTGSLYHCATAFLALGLPPDSPFWSGPDLPWSQKALWGDAGSIPIDKAVD